VRLLVGRDLERRRGRHAPPEPFAIEEIDVQREQGVDGLSRNGRSSLNR
jgi:hypothetical protein